MAKITREVAEKDYKRFLDSLDLDEELNKDILENQEQANNLIKAIQKGRLLIDEGGTPSIDFIYSNKLRAKNNPDVKQLDKVVISNASELFFELSNGGITAKAIAYCTGLMVNQVKQLDPRDNILITSIIGFFIVD
jgi:hypothetical protein